jgi:adenylate cyclase
MLLALTRLNESRARRGERPIRMGIGLHWGPAVLGDIGTERNAAFVVIGDTVNSASRLQAATRDFDAAMIVSQSLVDAVRAEAIEGAEALLADLIDLGEHNLRGRTKAVRLWALRAPAA